MEFLDVSIDLQKKIDRKTRARHGIFFTPRSLREIVLNKVHFIPKRILDPTCGSGEFLLDCAKRWPNASLTGVEFVEDIVKETKKIVGDGIHHADFMTWDDDSTFDLIVGNPPFVKIHKSPNKHMYETSSNLFIEVPFKCIEKHLEPHGVLAMVIPSTIQNGKWCSKLRELFFKMTIEHFEIIRNHDFKDTQAGVALIVVRNAPGDNRLFDYEGILTEHASHLRSMTNGLKRLSDLELKIVGGAGNARDYKRAREGDEKDVVFICTGDFKQDEVVFGEKRLYVKSSRYMSGRCLLLSRTKGFIMGDGYELKYAMFDHPKFLFETCMYALVGNDIDKMYESFRDERTSYYLRTICGSGRLTVPMIKSIPVFV